MSPRPPSNTTAAPSPFAPLVGRKAVLQVEQVGKVSTVALPAEYGGMVIPVAFGSLPPNTRVGQLVEVFVMTDSLGLPVASTTLPMLTFDEVRFLEVTADTDLGVFVDWGLPKELLVPKREQLVRMRPGQRYPIALKTDRQGRLLGTAQVAELLHREPHPFTAGQWVDGEAWRNDPNIGLFAIIQGKWVGLVPKDEPHRQTRGQNSKYRISHVLPDGKLELSLRNPGAVELPNDVTLVLDVLTENPSLRVGDDTPPDEIRDRFGISKKAFKRVLGVLLKRGDIEFDAHGFARVTRSER